MTHPRRSNLFLATLCAGLLFSTTATAQHDHEPHADPANASAPAQQAPAATPVLANEWCPVLTDEKVDPEVHGEFSGQQVFFCCRKCLKRFTQDPAAYAAQLPPQLARLVLSQKSAGAEAHEQGHGGDDDHGDDDHDDGHDDHDDGHDGHDDHGDAGDAGDHEAAGHDHDGAANHGQQADHDHSAHGDAGGGAAEVWIGWIGRLHPMVVHFPIALLLVAALARVLALRLSSEAFAASSRCCLWAGALGAVAAAALGWADAVGAAPGYAGFSAEVLGYHRWAGTLTATVAVLTVVAGERSLRVPDGTWRRWHHLGLALCVVLVSLAGHLGASLIFGWDYLSLP